MTIKMFIAAIGTIALLSSGVANAQTAKKPPQQASRARRNRWNARSRLMQRACTASRARSS